MADTWLDLWDNDDEPPTDTSYDLPRTIPDYEPERFGAPLEPRSEAFEEQIYHRICAAMRDASGCWMLPYGVGLTWSLLDAGEPADAEGWGEVPAVYAIRAIVVHAVQATEPGEEWQGSRTEVRRDTLWLMRRHLPALEAARPQLYGGTARVLLEPPIGSSDLAPLQALEVTVVHAPPAGRPAGDEEGFWSVTRQLRARDLSRPLVLAMATKPVGLPG